MKKIIIVLFTSSFGFCQNVESIKKLDTIYVSFTKTKGLKKNVYTDNYRDYHFSLQRENNINQNYLLFEKPDRKNSLTDKGNPRIDKRIEDKSFLKKHKKEIIDINFLKKFDAQYLACELLSDRKTLYIIDFTENTKGDLVLYRVNLVYLCPVYE